MKSRIAIGSTEHSDHTSHLGLLDAGLFEELSDEGLAQRLAPLDRPAGKRPRSGVAASNEEPATIVGAPRDGQTDDRSAKDVPKNFFHDADCSLRQERQRGEAHAPRVTTALWACILRAMKSLPVLFLLVAAVACQTQRTAPVFDDPGNGPVAGNANSGGAGATTATSTGANGSTGSGGAAAVPDCHCVYEIFHVQKCAQCEIAAVAGICGAFRTACINNKDCEANLTLVCPSSKDDPASVKLCLTTQSVAGDTLLADYFACLCEDPGPCLGDCNAKLQCGMTSSSSSGSSSSSSAASTSASTGTGN